MSWNPVAVSVVLTVSNLVKFLEKIENITRDHSFSTYAKFSEKLTFFTP